MPKYVIEREVPGASRLTEAELQTIAATSNKVLAELGVPYHWLQTFVAGDRLYCVHIAPDEATVRRHAELGGFPVTRVEEVVSIIDPTTADG
ncbi:MAG TPA: DUF4242 domain-containing protein [Chloroflexaceae bacterium]|nr:DUF4242 domain-containing protein [Chloroflexaceae bacterium]